MKKKLCLLFVLFLLFPIFVKANIMCNDGTESPTCNDCHSGCCSWHGGCYSEYDYDEENDSNSSSIVWIVIVGIGIGILVLRCYNNDNK